MLVFWKEKLVLLAVPKTGTTAIQGALAPRASIVVRDPPIMKHSPVYRYHRFMRPFLKQMGGENIEIMAIIREPVSWLGSWYRYRHRDDLVGHANSTRDLSFDDFVNEYLKGKPAGFANVGSQARFLMSGDGTLGVEHLFRYEAQSAAIGFLEQRLNMQIKTKQLNVSPAFELQLSPEIAAKFRKKRPEEFEFWENAQH